MESVDPVRGPYQIPKRGRLPQGLLPGPHEVMVLRARSGRVIELPRGCPPTFSQRMVGNFAEAYYVDCGGPHSRTFTAPLRTRDIGVDLIAEVDVEMVVVDCIRAVVERRRSGYLAEQLSQWVQHHASRLTSSFKVSTDRADSDLSSFGGRVLAALQTESRRLNFSGLQIRELRVRLRLANDDIVTPAGAETLTAKLRAQRLNDLYQMYIPVFGIEFARIYASLSMQHESDVPAFLERLQAEQRASSERKYAVLISLLQGESIEAHLKEQLLKELATALLLPGIDPPARELASALLRAGAATGIADATASTSNLHRIDSSREYWREGFVRRNDGGI